MKESAIHVNGVENDLYRQAMCGCKNIGNQQFHSVGV